MKKAIITPILVNIVILLSFNFLFPGSAGLGGVLALTILAPVFIGLILTAHILIALFYFLFSDRALSSKNKIINFVVYILVSLLVFVPYAVKFVF